jgi:hypothetical protein
MDYHRRALSGTLAGRLVTFSKQGFGFWHHLGLGMLGAVVVVGLFWLLSIDLSLGEIKITFEDLISASVARCLPRRVVADRKNRAPKAPSQNLETSTKQGCLHGSDISPACFAVCSMHFPQVSETHHTAALGAPASEDDGHAAHRESALAARRVDFHPHHPRRPHRAGRDFVGDLAERFSVCRRARLLRFRAVALRAYAINDSGVVAMALKRLDSTRGISRAHVFIISRIS